MGHCWTLVHGCPKGTRGPEAQGFRRDQEGLSALHQGEGVLQQKLRSSCEVSGGWTQRSASSKCGAFHACRAHDASTVFRAAIYSGRTTESSTPLYTFQQ